MWDGKTYDHIIWKQLKPEFMKLWLIPHIYY
jgi:hypothetical protein